MTFDLSRDTFVLCLLMPRWRSQLLREMLQNYDKRVALEEPWPIYIRSQWFCLSSRRGDVRKETVCLCFCTCVDQFSPHGFHPRLKWIPFADNHWPTLATVVGDAHVCVSLSQSTGESWRPLTPHELIDDADISWTSLKLPNTSVSFRRRFNGYYQLVWCALNCWGQAAVLWNVRKAFSPICI